MTDTTPPDAPASALVPAKRHRLARWLSLLLTLPLAALGAAAIAYVGGHGAPDGLRIVLALTYAGMVVVPPLRQSPPLRGLGVSAVLFFVVATWWAALPPSNDRAWSPAASRTAWAEIDGDRVTIHDVRDFRYRSATDFDARWYDATYDVSRIERGYFVLSRFTEFEGVAHVMVSFRFDAEPVDQFLTISIEIRREEGEAYDPVAGLFRQFEVIYIAADERDALALRTNIYDDPTWIMPMDAGPEKTREFFLDMVRRMNGLRERPEWYNSITNSCATNLADHYERINDVKLPIDYRVILPGFSDQVVAELGLLPEGMSADEARARFLANELGQAAGVGPGFSEAVRPWE